MFWFFPQILLAILLVVFFIVHRVIKKSGISVKQYYTNYIAKSYKTSTGFDIISFFYFEIYKFFVIILFSGVIGYIVCLLMDYYKKIDNFEIIHRLADFLQSDIWSWFGIVLTLSVVLVAFRKEYYLAFNNKEIFLSYHFCDKTFEGMIIIVLSKCLMFVSEIYVSKDQKIWMAILDIIDIVLCIWCYILLINLFYIIVKLVFSEEQNELKILEHLYHKIEQRTWQVESINKEVSDNAILINVEYLLDQFIKSLKKIEKKNFVNFELHLVYGEYERDAYKRIKCFLEKTLLVWGGIIAAIIFIQFGMSPTINYIFFKNVVGGNVVLIIICYLILEVIGIVKGASSARQLFNHFFLHNYVIEYETEKEKNIISVDGFSPFNKNSDFVKAILNMIVFYKILEESKVKMKRVLKQIEKLYVYHEEYKKDYNDCFYIIIIYYNFLYYWNLNKKDREKFTEEIRGKRWIEKIKKQEIVQLVKVMINYTERGYKKEDALRMFDNFRCMILREDLERRVKR